MINKIEQLTEKSPVGVLVATNGMLLVSFVATVFLYREAKEEGLSKVLGALQVLGI